MYAINFGLFMICIFNSSSVIYRIINPKLPSIRVQEKGLLDVKFPLSFRICVHDITNREERVFLGALKGNQGFKKGILLGLLIHLEGF